MIKFSVGIAYEQNRPTDVASALRAQFVFFGEKCLKNSLYKSFSDKSYCKSQYAAFGAKNIFDHPTGLASALVAQLTFLAKSLIKMHSTNIFFRQKL